MCGRDLPRLYELRDQLQNPVSPDAYDFDVGDNRVALKCLRDIEADLQGLDSTSWCCFKTDLVPLLTKKDLKRGWRELFDRLNEAKGYNYLVRAGCTDVRFIPRSSTHGQKTPDLEGSLGATKVLCEVKTINISEAECARRDSGGVISIPIQLPDGFFNKMKSVLEAARDQMLTYYPAPGTKRVAYIILNYDDLLHLCAAAYATQINAFVATKPVPGLEIFFDAKPAYYFAMA